MESERRYVELKEGARWLTGACQGNGNDLESESRGQVAGIGENIGRDGIGEGNQGEEKVHQFQGSFNG